MIKDFLQFLLVTATVMIVSATIIYVFGFISCTNASRMLKTPSMYVFNKCYVMNADGNYIPEEVYIELLKYGE